MDSKQSERATGYWCSQKSCFFVILTSAFLGVVLIHLSTSKWATSPTMFMSSRINWNYKRLFSGQPYINTSTKMNANISNNANISTDANIIATANADISADANISTNANISATANANNSATANADISADANISATSNADVSADANISATANANISATANADISADAIMSVAANANIVTNAYISATAANANISTNAIHIAGVICGNRVKEGTTMMKSAFIFSKTFLVFHIFTEDKLRKPIDDVIKVWSGSGTPRVAIIFYSIQYPFSKPCPTCTVDAWNNLFRPCAAQRLFIPVIMTDVDSVIYLDTDTVFLSPVENVWAMFQQFSHSQIAAISSELSGWYANKAFPYCTATGVNSGVFLMNLTRLRASPWQDKMIDYYVRYKSMLQLGDQDLINLYCHFHRDQFYILPCSYNYRGIFCAKNNLCNETELSGAFILHGNSGAFHTAIFPAVKAVYNALKEFNPATQNVGALHSRMSANIQQLPLTDCGKHPHLLMRNVEKYVAANNQTGN